MIADMSYGPHISSSLALTGRIPIIAQPKHNASGSPCPVFEKTHELVLRVSVPPLLGISTMSLQKDADAMVQGGRSLNAFDPSATTSPDLHRVRNGVRDGACFDLLGSCLNAL